MNFGSVFHNHSRPLAALCAIALLVGWVATHERVDEHPHLRRAFPRVVSGDEPHYLIIVHSLLFDHDLFLENNYDDAARGGPQVGAVCAGITLDPHAYLINYDRCLSIKWHDLYDLKQPLAVPDEHGVMYAPKRPNSFRPGAYHLVPAHPIGYPAFLAAVLSPFRPAPADIERFVAVVQIAVCLLTIFVGYAAALSAGLSKAESVAAVALFALCSPWLGYTKSFFSEPLAGLLLLSGLLAYLRSWMVPAAFAIAAAMWVKAPYALFGAAWIVDCVCRRRFRDVAVLATILGAACLALIIFNHRYTLDWLICGAVSLKLGWQNRFFFKTLFAPNEGLFPFTPWAIMMLMAMLAIRDQGPMRRLALPLVLPLGLYLVVLSSIGFSPGWTFACRHWIPFMPWLAIPVAAVLRWKSRVARGALLALACAGLAMSIPSALAYGHGTWRQPPYHALVRWHAD
jgi:hypothetical protein